MTLNFTQSLPWTLASLAKLSTLICLTDMSTRANPHPNLPTHTHTFTCDDDSRALVIILPLLSAIQLQLRLLLLLPPPFYAPFTPQDLLATLVVALAWCDPSTSPLNRLTHFLFSALFMCRHYSVCVQCVLLVYARIYRTFDDTLGQRVGGRPTWASACSICLIDVSLPV